MVPQKRKHRLTSGKKKRRALADDACVLYLRTTQVHVELDRSRAMEDVGYLTCLTRLLQPELHEYKADLLVGVFREAVGTRFAWPWGPPLAANDHC